ncbi:MAG: T9SS type A sorting domain-containing protein [Candidatus Zixiibacteriota bacterium]|nr:MAG: T9SS type A sorting domain-containing protein [candidate division Zixibacteria bacterium]
MRTLALLTILSILSTGICPAQDPGARDTIIVEIVFAEVGDSAADVSAYVVCDDSVAFYNMPLTWSSSDSLINLSHVSYNNVLLEWDETYDSLITSLGFLRMIGWNDICGDDNPTLFAPTYRLLCWTFHFSIDSLAVPQVITIDTTFDPVNGSLLFGEVGGVNAFIPEFIPGGIFYGITSGFGDQESALPTELVLFQNYPNPFNPATTLSYSLPEPSEITISIFNILGQRADILIQSEKSAGIHTVTWDATIFPSGVYFARLESGGSSKSIKMLLLK